MIGGGLIGRGANKRGGLIRGFTVFTLIDFCLDFFRQFFSSECLYDVKNEIFEALSRSLALFLAKLENKNGN